MYEHSIFLINEYALGYKILPYKDAIEKPEQTFTMAERAIVKALNEISYLPIDKIDNEDDKRNVIHRSAKMTTKAALFGIKSPIAIEAEPQKSILAKNGKSAGPKIDAFTKGLSKVRN